MKAQLIFNLEDEEDKRKFQEIAGDDVSKLKCAVHEFSEQILRKYRKYKIPLVEIEGVTELTKGKLPSEDEYAIAQCVVEHLEKKFYECLQQYDAKVE